MKDEPPMLRMKVVCVFLLGLLWSVAAHAKDEPQIMVWPETGKPVLRFSFGKFKEGPSYVHERNYTCETTVQNLWDKKISVATFSLYLFDKSNARIGEGFVQVSNMGPGEVIKFQTSVHAAGVPVTVKLVPQALPAELRPAASARTVSVTVNSVPQGAALKVDGNDAGTTPKVIRVTTGPHVLEFSKEGFNTGRFPLEIGPDDTSGGSVSFELGTSVHDTLELRDGSVMVCDVESMSATEVVVRVGGTLQHVDRNQVKRVLLVERDQPAK